MKRFPQELESVLFAVTSVAENVEMDESVDVPQLFTILSTLPYTSSQVISQALTLIGEST